jgi:hypothetical protein
MDRHARQAKLAEVGPAGQARIGRAVVSVPFGGWAADVAVRYLAGAGVAAVRVPDAQLAEGARALAPGLCVEVDPALAGADGGPGRSDARPAASVLRDPAARELLRGALAALEAIRGALGEGDR